MATAARKKAGTNIPELDITPVEEAKITLPPAAKKKVIKEGIVQNPETPLEEHSNAVRIEAPVTVTPRTYSADDLNDAAKMLMRAFPDHIQLAVEQAAVQRGITLWQELCSLVYYCFNGGLMYTGYLDPAWDSGAPILQPESVCAYCGMVYTPKWRRQLFCSNECGSKAATKVPA